MKSEPSPLMRAPTILFFVTGVFWAGIVVTGGALPLGWAAISCFASGIFLTMWTSSWITHPLVAASSLFGIVLTLYQLYVGITVLVSGPTSVAIVSAPLFLVFTLVYLYLVYSCVLKPQPK